MNSLHIAGHLGADPEVRFTSSGLKVTTLRVAAKARRGGKDKTIWWRVSVWGEQFDKMIGYLKKGSAVMAMGEMHEPEIFENRDGKPQVSMNLTATSLMFNPFGKSDKPVGENQMSSSTVSAGVNAQSNVSSKDKNEGVASGSAADFKMSDFPADDEVPF